jgi:predicted  nucleic acid-binding Zn-ribbon protein
MLAQDVGLEVTAPEAAVYEGQSGGIIDMMEQLESKLEDEKETLEKEEANARHSADMMQQTLTDKIEQETQDRGSKVSQKKGKEQAAGEAKGELAQTQNTLAEDTKYLEDLKQLYESKKIDYAARQELRAGELEALDKAIEIIASGAVSGAADTHLPSFYQRGTALVQLRSGSEPSQKAVAQFLQAQGQRMNSQLLAALAIRVQQDPFGKVKKMIKDMIIKLTEEATEEAEHKGFCDTELTTNKQTRDAKTTSVAELTAEIEMLTAEVQKLTVENKDLSDQIADIDKAVAEATETRNAEKEKNAKTVADATAAKAAVEQAMSVLKTFYDKAATATALDQSGPIVYDDRAINILSKASLLQTGSKTRGPADDVPTTFDKPYTGGGAEGGILGMLEVILSDFERLEEETSTSELTAAKDYKTFMADSDEDKAVKTADMTHNGNLITKRNSDNASAKKDLKATQAELDAALEYYEKLKPSCVDAGESYEERVQRREDEIQSLKEALKILAP